MRYPAAIPASALCAGISAGIFLSVSLHPEALACLWLVALAAYLARREHATIAILVFGFFAAGASLGQSADSASRNQPLRAVFDHHVRPGDHQIFVTLHARLRAQTPPMVRQASRSMSSSIVSILTGPSYETAGGALVSVGGEVTAEQILQWRGGRRVVFPGTLRRPTRYLNAGVPDGERHLAWRSTALVGSVKSGRLIALMARGSVFDEGLADARAFVRRAVALNIGRYDERSAAVALAILIGDRAGLTHEVERRLQEAGTYHVIAISGGNIAIIASLFVCLFRALKCGPRTVALLVVGLLTVYALGVQGGPSVGRATLMAIIYFAAQLWDHRTTPLNVTGLSATALFCANPLEVVDAGFALTFGATLGILVGMSKLSDALLPAGWPRVLVALLIASACAEVALLPVNAFVFSRITFAGLIVNFAAIPLMTIVQTAGIATVVASMCLPEVCPGWGGLRISA